MEIITEMVDTIIEAAEDVKASDIKTIDVRGKTSIADYFVLVSGSNPTQIKAIGHNVEKAMETLGKEKINRSGYDNPKWVVLDYSDVVLHIFDKGEREFYNLERIWEEMETK